MWEEFQKERNKLTADKARFDLAQKKRILRKLENVKNVEIIGPLRLRLLPLFSQLRLLSWGLCIT